MKILFLLLIITLCGNHVDAYRILMVSTIPSKSHNNLCTPIVDTLSLKGHDVTFITPFPRKDAPCREIGVPELYDFKESLPTFGFSISEMTMAESLIMLAMLQTPAAEMIFKNHDFKTFMNNDTEKFDLVIIETMINEFLFGFSAKYNCPLVVLIPFNMMSMTSKMIGNPYSLATNPNNYLELTSNMNFFERTKNFLYASLQEILDVFYLDNAQKVLYEKYFANESMIIPYDELKTRISLVLMNTHPSIGIARPLLPNVIQIGGYHLKDPEPLPKDLKTVMDSSKNGVIYFSLGSVVSGNKMDLEMKQTFLKSFSKLKETVLLKFEEDLPEKSSNVIIENWMPQSSILAHPNLKLFITHGGLLSCTEAANYGVPMIVIPIFADQPQNAKFVAENGRGLVIKINNITEESLNWAINEILTNPKYNESAKVTQKVFQDRPMKPRDLMVYHVEHVIRTEGAKHLLPPKLSRISLLLLDVFAVLLISRGIILYILIRCCKRIFRRIRSKVKEQ